MKYRTLGQGLKVSAIGVGCMPMVREGNINYGNANDTESTATIHRAIDLGRDRQTMLIEQLIETRQILRWRTASHMIERQHRVGLAAAKVSLQLDNRITAAARQAFGGTYKQHT